MELNPFLGWALLLFNFHFPQSPGLNVMEWCSLLVATLILTVLHISEN